MRPSVAALALFVLTSPSPAYSEPVEAGELAGVATVVDGDTIEVAGERLRFRDVRAPELHDPAGPPAADFLAELVEGRRVVCTTRGRGKYGRLLGDCRVEGATATLQEALLRAGWALPYARAPVRLKAIAETAHAARRGIWCVLPAAPR